MKYFQSIMYPLLLTVSIIASIAGCNFRIGKNERNETVVSLDRDLFLTGTTVKSVNCTLSDGTRTVCYEITSTTPTDHEMGPWCPDDITDAADAGGIWINEGKVHDVDGNFIENLASFYNDSTWQMYDANGKVYKTITKEDCINAANPNVGEEYKNFCVECVPDHIAGITHTWLIPITPVMQSSSASFAMGGGPGRGRPTGGERPPRGERPNGGGRPEERGRSGPGVRGIAFNGVEFSASAPLNHILGAYTLAPFDDAGGHINVHQGYHYHAATGVSTEIKQADGHAPMIGYAMDGHGIYAQLNEDGKEPYDLDACRGHYDQTRGYHYHVDAPGANNFINCLAGAYSN